MADFILDASVVMAWCFDDEKDEYADTVLDSFSEKSALAPSIWPLEIGNVLVVAERRSRITSIASSQFLELLRQLPIEVELTSDQRMFNAILRLAREHSLSTYDAAYIDLAKQTNLPLATLDRVLEKAAARNGVKRF